MLSCHLDISTHSELWFLLPHIDAIRNQYFLSLYGANSLRDATNGLLEQLPNGEDDYFKSIRLMSDGIYNQLAPGGERYVLDKTPRYYFIIEEISKLYPDAKFIFLFRNPLDVAASLVSSFNRGKLGDCYHRIDMFEGPKMLANGYMRLREKSIAVSYEDLVANPMQSLCEICEYLELEYMPEMISDFVNVPVGVMGDQYGSKLHKSVTVQSVEKWRDVFGTHYRRNFLLKLLNHIGASAIDCIGYDFKTLQQDLTEMKVRRTVALEDRYREALCCIYSYFEVPLIKDKLRGRISGQHKRYIHQ
jgi:hypothetical protein